MRAPFSKLDLGSKRSGIWPRRKRRGRTEGRVDSGVDDPDGVTRLLRLARPDFFERADVPPERRLEVPPDGLGVRLLELVRLAGGVPPEEIEEGFQGEEARVEEREGGGDRGRVGSEERDEVRQDLGGGLKRREARLVNLSPDDYE